MTFILLDGNSFCYRAFYAIRELRNSKGEPTNAIYGFITMLEKIVKDVKPDGAAVAFDLKGPTLRHKQYEDYKVHRAPMPDDLVFQMPLIKDVIRAMKIPIFEKEGYEADDMIGTLSKEISKKGHDVFIVTGDKDMLQLVTKKVKVLNPQKDNIILDEAAVKARFGVGPDRVVDIMALMGDASDNIPGVPGIGEKTAVKLIGEYGSLEAVLKNIAKLKGDKLKENLVKHEKDAYMSRELATIIRDVKCDIALDELELREPDTDKLAELYQRFEFRTLLKNMPDTRPKNGDDAGLDYTLVETKADFEKLKKRLAKENMWAFDFETTHVDPMLAQPVGVSFSFKEKEAFFVSFREELKWKPSLEELKPLFEDPKIKKIGQNIKYEIMVLMNSGIELEGVWFDTMVANYVVDPSRPNHSLDALALLHLGVTITDIVELIGKGKDQITMDKVDIEKLYKYGCQDADVTFRLAAILEKKLKERDSWELFQNIEMPLVPVLAQMEYAGVAIDKKLLSDLSGEMETEIKALTKRIYKEAGAEFNINSPKQLGEILFDKLKLPMVKKTKTGASTDSGVLAELSEYHTLPKEILKFREFSKLKSTYVDALPAMASPKDGRVHTSFNQTVAATGRLSSTDPNLQNIPIRTEEGRKIRRAFTALKGNALLSADYSQIELRVLAHLSGDAKLIQAFKEGADIHRFTAALVFDVPMKSVTPEQRNSAKTVNFGVLYGMGAFSLAKQLGISNKEAAEFIKNYFDRYPGIKKCLDGMLEGARRDGFVTTAFKRRRYMPEIHSKDPRLRAFAERTAINAPMQGTASDIIKMAMVSVQQSLGEKKMASRMILQVHDELVFEGPKAEMAALSKLVRAQMQGAAKFKVPLEVSVKTGPNWLDMEEIE
jgi:DNA polymerase I